MRRITYVRTGIPMTRLMPSLSRGTLKLMSKPSLQPVALRYVKTWAT
jgi:hypothetical protein